ncbi:amino acid permease [Lecanosticta acicola]|uniref:Amino acid permease n=1 Tax=Lecanosticta acicola TaxID=111012 RepID=A0AAI9EDS9_9PEZI|nr:amino acid permease [Lecanosticta acicola]
MASANDEKDILQAYEDPIRGVNSDIVAQTRVETLVWGFLLVWTGVMAQTASLAEMAAAQPIAGAMYHWTWALAPTDIRRFSTWLQGWNTWTGWISMTVGICNSTANWIISLVQLNYPDYVATGWHSTLMVFAMMVVCVAFNVYKFGRLVPWIESIAGGLHFAMFIAFSITLLAMAKKHSASFVFLSRVDATQTSGWTNEFISWNLGLQTSVWVFVGFDAAVHLSEEVRRAPNTVPRVMVYTNLPMLAVFLHATGSTRAATAMGSLLVFNGILALLSGVASMSRLSWSWARDGGLPKVFAYVDAQKRVPARAVLFSSMLVVLLSLVNIGSTVAMQVFISLSTIAMYLSYFIAILMMFLRRLSSSSSPSPQLGPWTMGKLGMPVNIFALVYTAYIIIWLPFPTTIPITGANFNYASPMLFFVILLALGLWVFRRRTWPGLREDIVEVAINK